MMNGSVVSFLEKPKIDQINEKLNKYISMFYVGEQLTDYELDVERQYLSKKYLKHINFSKRKSTRYKVRWTISDLNRYQEQKNYRMNDPEYFANIKPIFEEFDLDKAMKALDTHHDINKVSKFRRALTWFTDVKAYERGKSRSKLAA